MDTESGRPLASLDVERPQDGHLDLIEDHGESRSSSKHGGRDRHRQRRHQRWRDAVGTLLTLQAEYADWLAALPDSLRDSATADALEAIIDLDLMPLADIEPPSGYGRD